MRLYKHNYTQLLKYNEADDQHKYGKTLIMLDGREYDDDDILLLEKPCPSVRSSVTFFTPSNANAHT